MSSSSSPDFAFPQFEQVVPAAPRVRGRSAVAEPPPAALLDAAREEAERLLDAARHEAEDIRAQARAVGEAEGREAAAARAREDLRPAAEALGAAAQEVRASALAAAQALEREAVTLALGMAEKVMASTVSVEPERVVDVVRGALRCLVEREHVVVCVNPADMELVRGAAEDLRRSLGGIEHLEVQEERRVSRGGAIVRSATGEVDARLETKLERVHEVMVRELAG